MSYTKSPVKEIVVILTEIKRYENSKSYLLSIQAIEFNVFSLYFSYDEISSEIRFIRYK